MALPTISVWISRQALAESVEAVMPSFTDAADFFLIRHWLLRANEAFAVREQAIRLAYGRMLARFLEPRLAAHADGPLLADIIAVATVTVVNRAQYDWASSGGTIDPIAATRSGMALLIDVFGRVAEPEPRHGGGQPTLVVISQDGVLQPDVLERLGRALSE